MQREWFFLFVIIIELNFCQMKKIDFVHNLKKNILLLQMYMILA